MNSEALGGTLATILSPAIEERVGIAAVCSACGRTAEIVDGGDADTALMQALVEHAAYEHATRADLLQSRTTPLLSSNELGILLGLPAGTEAEERWRREQGPIRS